MMHSKQVKTPLQWISVLSESIRESRGQINGKEVPVDKAMARTADILAAAGKEKASVFWVGNGGSSAICSHLSQDIMNKLKVKSFYCGDTSLMTCMANDFGYENVYARPLELLAGKNDILMAISSSGNSENIISSVRTAREKGMKVVSLSGMKADNKLWNSNSDVSFLVLSDLYGIVEVSHEAILHGIIETLWLKTEDD